ncbi:CHRD domain-containing protein [Wenjunlia tyrosinilytica]|uniref:CHRD domain-containing protein n=1 Tax=Wenjunlia tyrosinilytica TaxID=1544741 RepID=A0A917ZSG6_9ACTN|nr:CHRD domain-containing protein [Wenjunlia tyrosinilytica]GGO88920.1 hypothetical protein GCM10012280_30850 [Wenjunlia tyrosinilytica]
MNMTTGRRTARAVGVVAAIAGAGLTLAVSPVSAHSQGHSTAPAYAKAWYFAGSLTGANEVPVPGGPATGDKDGRAIEFVKIQGNKVSFAIQWKGIKAPTNAHIHQGKKGANGPVKIDFFHEKLPDSLNSVTGSVTVNDAHLLKDIINDPSSFYFNLHTGEFPGGAVRGQLHKLTEPVAINKALGSFQASVVKGKQIYACTKQSDGSYKFTQNNVSAKLDRGIAHSFVHPNAGPPQWKAPDGSAVTGTLVTKTPNGTDNIPELDLLANQSGKKSGLLSKTAEILRLNTVGGVAPAGTCDPYTHPKVGVPYQADYLFVTK